MNIARLSGITPPLPPHDRFRIEFPPCEKCGEPEPSIAYVNWCGAGHADGEHFHLTCRRCGYVAWSLIPKIDYANLGQTYPYCPLCGRHHVPACAPR